MSTFIAILPIVIIVLLIASMGWVGMRFDKVKAVLSKRKTVTILLGAYVAVAIGAVVVYESLPDRNVPVDFVSAEEVDQKTRDFEAAIREGRVEDVDPDWLLQKWEFAYSDEVLHLKEPAAQWTSRVMVERKDENDGLIEASFYMSVVNRGLDYTDGINPIDVKVADGNLRIFPASEHWSREISIFKKEFVISQFTGEKWLSMDPEVDGSRNIQLLYMRIPQKVQIDNESGIYVEYTE